jgi:hypothetical protein
MAHIWKAKHFFPARHSIVYAEWFFRSKAVIFGQRFICSARLNDFRLDTRPILGVSLFFVRELVQQDGLNRLEGYEV